MQMRVQMAGALDHGAKSEIKKGSALCSVSLSLADTVGRKADKLHGA